MVLIKSLQHFNNIKQQQENAMDIVKFKDAMGMTPKEATDLLRYEESSYVRWTAGGSPSAATQRLMEILVWAHRLNLVDKMVSGEPPIMVRTWRKRMGVSQERAAAILGTPKITFVQWEHRSTRPHPSVNLLLHCVEWLFNNRLLEAFMAGAGK
jgi:DNA-binding XRE family transcriptional regulator